MCVRVGQRHEGQSGAADDGGVEMARNVKGVVHDDVQLLRAHHHAGDAAEKPEDEYRQEHAGEGRVAPRRLAQPFEKALVEAALALRRLDRARHREPVDHAREHREVHGVAGVEDLPFRAEARVDQYVVGAGQLQEQDVQQERHARDLFGQRLGPEHDTGDEVPHGDVGRDVDLL